MSQAADVKKKPKSLTASTKDAAEASSQPMATIQDDDERLLARIGYKQARLYTGTAHLNPL